MPVYTYRCDNCGHQFDKHQNFSDDPLKACPQCRKHALHKVYQATGVAFKGSGFYVTDKRNASAAKPTKAATNGSGDSKSETKSATSESKSTPAESKGESSKPAKKDN